MQQQAAFSVSIAHDVPPDERAALVSALRAHATVQEQPTTRAIDPVTIATLVVIMGAVKATADTIKASADAGKSVFDLAQTINKWRRDTQTRGITPGVQLEHPNQPPLNLATATDKQVLEWLLQTQPEP